MEGEGGGLGRISGENRLLVCSPAQVHHVPLGHAGGREDQEEAQVLNCPAPHMNKSVRLLSNRKSINLSENVLQIILLYSNI